MNRLCIKITGESGAGLLSTGDIIIKAFQYLGFYVVADREYPSLIKGGHACFVINVSREPIHAISTKVDVMLAIDKQSLEAYYKDLKDGGLLVYGYERPLGVKEYVAELEGRNVQVVHRPVREIAEEMGGNVLMTNVVLAGMFWKTLGLPYPPIERSVNEKFADKPKLLAIDLKCLEAGYGQVEELMKIEVPAKARETVLLDGNRAIALGAVNAGCRAYYAYPMSPSSSILTYMAEMAPATKMLVKQVEDEISVVNMTIGSMHMGTRAMCATSGGGYDLMTEGVSLAGIIECPLVVVIAQRPGPGTGLPTWTAQGDLNLAVYSSHGEFARLVIGVSDVVDCFELIQHAFNYAERFQIPVIVLTEKVIAETDKNVDNLPLNKVPIERGLVTGEELADLKSEDRYKITESGLSKRWVPGSSEAYFFANGDEHWEDGSLTEEADQAGEMYAKRVRKMQLVEDALPEPVIYGDSAGADISFIGWGSSKNAVLDTMQRCAAKGMKVNYLHYSYLFPLKTKVAQEFFAQNKNVCLIEGNYLGQLGDMVEAKLGVKFAGRLLKYNGRPFFVEDVEEFVEKKCPQKLDSSTK